MFPWLLTALPYVRKFAVPVLVVAAVVGMYFYAYRRGAASESEKWERRYSADMAAALERARLVEHDAAARIAEIDQRYAHNLREVNENATRTIDDLRNGNLRLRRRLSACHPGTGVPPANPGSGVGSDTPGGGLLREDVEFLVREAARADAVATQLRACQEIVTSDREHYNTL